MTFRTDFGTMKYKFQRPNSIGVPLLPRTGVWAMSDTPTEATSRPSFPTLPTARTTPFDPPPQLQQIQAQRSLSPLRYPDGHLGWLVTGYDLAREVLCHQSFSSRMDLIRLPVRRPATDSLIGKPTPPGWFLGMDRPDHAKYRKILAGHFTSRKVSQLRPQIEEIVKNALDAISNMQSPVNLVPTFSQVIPSLTICELLGVPTEDRPRLHAANEILLNTDTTSEEGISAWNMIQGYLRELIHHHKSTETNDIYGLIIGRNELTDDELIGVGALLLTAGLDTVANMIALGVMALICYPDQRQILTDNPSLIDNSVEELLRYLTIFQHGLIRTAIEDVTILDQQIKCGDSVTVALSIANRDPSQFSSPYSLDITRSTLGHVSFGHGIHQCIGQHLARLEMKTAYLSLFERFPNLTLAESVDNIPVRSDMATYGVHDLLVTW